MRFADGADLKVKQHIRASYRECVDMDLSKYFDRRPMLRIVARYDVLLVRVARKFRDKRLLRLIGSYLHRS